MLLDAMQNSFNFVLARNAHYAARSDERGGKCEKWHGKSKRIVCVCVSADGAAMTGGK